MRVLFAGGGSIGHLAPAVAVWNVLRTVQPDSEPLFICSTRGNDRSFLEQQSLPVRAIPYPRLSLSFPLTFLQGLSTARQVMEEFRPDVIFCKGSAVSVPVCLAARKRGIPIVVHESDAVSGRATRFVTRFATVACYGFESSALAAMRHASKRRTAHIFTGNPVRPDITQGDRERGINICGLSGKKPILLVIGGSQGAEALNRAVREHLSEILRSYDVIHLTGEGKEGAPPTEGYWSAPFAHDTLPHLYAASSVALSRAGAGLISELAACGIGAILVPLTQVAHDHQEANARAVEQTGGCIVLPQKKLDASLIALLEDLALHPEKRESLSNAIKGLSQPDAARHITDLLIKAFSNRS